MYYFFFFFWGGAYFYEYYNYLFRLMLLPLELGLKRTSSSPCQPSREEIHSRGMWSSERFYSVPLDHRLTLGRLKRCLPPTPAYSTSPTTTSGPETWTIARELTGSTPPRKMSKTSLSPDAESPRLQLLLSPGPVHQPDMWLQLQRRLPGFLWSVESLSASMREFD